MPAGKSFQNRKAYELKNMPIVIFTGKSPSRTSI